MMLKMKILLTASLIVSIILSGCITNAPQLSSNERKVIGISTDKSLKVPSSQIENITQNQIENVTARGYSYEYTPGEENYTWRYYHRVYTNKFNLSSHKSGTELIVDIMLMQNISDSHIMAKYSPNLNFPESNLSEKKQWLEDRVNEIATICNLTVNWTQAQWTITYAD